jgi:hypothetical protein
MQGLKTHSKFILSLVAGFEMTNNLERRFHPRNRFFDLETVGFKLRREWLTKRHKVKRSKR